MLREGSLLGKENLHFLETTVTGWKLEGLREGLRLEADNYCVCVCVCVCVRARVCTSIHREGFICLN